MSSKSKSGLSETPSKASPAAPRLSKLNRGVTKSEPDSPAPLQSPHLSVDRSPRFINSKPTIDRRSPKVAAPPEKSQTRLVKGSELQTRLDLVEADLRKAKEQIAFIEKEKAQAIDELEQVQQAAKEANEKLQEALVAQKRAEENSEIEKFRAVELEQAGIEAVRKKEEEWRKELEAVQNQHALDVSALLSTNQELQKVKQELLVSTDAKNRALSHVNDATKIAEMHAEKVEILSAEVIRLKALLDSKLQTEASETNVLVLKLNEEMESLKQKLDKAKEFENKLMAREAYVERLNVELEAAKMAESYARSLVEEWKCRADELEVQVGKANKLERSASESLELIIRQLERNNGLLRDAEAETAALKEKLGLLETTIGRQKRDLEESERCLRCTKEEASAMAKEIESLKSELETMKEEKARALNNEKLAASSIQSLIEEKNKLVNDLENSKYEEGKSKKAMESLASALHEVSAEAREAKEKLLSIQVEHENYESEIENLRFALKEANERHRTMLDDAKHENGLLMDTIEKSRNDFQNSKHEWEQREQNLVDCVKKAEEDNTSLEKEIDRLVNLLKHAEEETGAMREEEVQLKDSLKEVEAEVIYLQESLREAQFESMKLKESILNKENELQSNVQENQQLRTREAVNLKKVEELSKLLEEAMATKQAKENDELTEREKDYDLLPKVVEFSKENSHMTSKKCETNRQAQQSEQPRHENSHENDDLKDEAAQTFAAKTENANEKPKEDENKEKEDSAEVEFKMPKSFKIEKKEFSPEKQPEQEAFEDEVDSKAKNNESFDHINRSSSAENGEEGGCSPSKQQPQRKKKPFLRKFGSLFKKKSTNNQK